MNVKELKVVIVNCNIDENHYITSEQNGYEDIEGMVGAINDYIEATEHIIDDETSIYHGHDLEMVKNKITKEELLEIIKDENQCIMIAEKKEDRDYCVYIAVVR